ncbi:hypothetical protein M501DRAFT_997183 [Patellaria atrata CBS 101060]|uniref:Uncharacterized protein n=1 Tax=Patellaria atrata CBS 101060 TaxID=1346257 RepID=A0A9P4VLV9_9PEZI|nr:hypothetical protein M501DRAFT_997183 [Patellaria atrata CBS 101060]
MRAKYAIQDADLYNFDETGFMMGVICGGMVVTRADRRGRGKQLQPGNRVCKQRRFCATSFLDCARRQPPRILVHRMRSPAFLGHQDLAKRLDG